MCRYSDAAKKRHPEGHAEVQDKGVYNGYEYPLVSGVAGNDGQGGVDGGSAAAADGRSRAHKAHQQWREEQGEEFAGILLIRAMVPSSGPLYCVMKMEESE